MTMILEDGSMPLKPNIELRIAEYRARTGHKIEDRELAELLGVTKQHFSACKNGRAQLKMEAAFKLSRKLGCYVDGEKGLYDYIEE